MEDQMTDFPPQHNQPPAYTNKKGAYTAVPQFDSAPPTGYSAPAPPPSGYAPAPPVFQQQSSSNVVVIGNQPAPQSEVVHVRAPRAPEYLMLTGVMMILCFLHGDLPAIIICLVPALICACAAQDNNNAGNYEGAKSCGSAALCCNIFAIVYFVLLILAGIAVALLYFFYLKDFLESEINKVIHDVTPAPICCNYNRWLDICQEYCN